MKKFLEFCRYSNRNIWFIIRLSLSALFNKFAIILNSKKFSKIAWNILCKYPYIQYTPFWNYLMESLWHYYMCTKDFEPEIWKLIKSISKRFNDEKYLINIWCNIWRYAIDLAKNYDYNVIAFEPTPSTYRNLKINIYLSDLANKIQTYNIWLGNENCDMFFEVWQSCDTCAHIVSRETVNTLKIPVKRFDDLWIDKEEIDKTRLIIIDVEWFEFDVIKWMEKSLKKFHDINVIMEIWEKHKDKDKTIDFMKKLWYSVSEIDESNYLFQK